MKRKQLTLALMIAEDPASGAIVAQIKDVDGEPILFGTIASVIRLAAPELFQRWVELMTDVTKQWAAANLGATDMTTTQLKPGEHN